MLTYSYILFLITLNMSDQEDDFIIEEDDLSITSTRGFLHKHLESKNQANKDGKSFKIALLNILRDGYGIRSKNDYRTLKKLLDENPIGISLPEEINIISDGTKILIYRDNKILVTNEKKDDIGTIDKNGFSEPYYDYGQKINIDLDVVFYA